MIASLARFRLFTKFEKIHVDVDDCSIDKIIKVDVPIISDTAAVLEGLLEEWQSRKIGNRHKEISRLVNKLKMANNKIIVLRAIWKRHKTRICAGALERFWPKLLRLLYRQTLVNIKMGGAILQFDQPKNGWLLADLEQWATAFSCFGRTNCQSWIFDNLCQRRRFHDEFARIGDN